MQNFIASLNFSEKGFNRKFFDKYQSEINGLIDSSSKRNVSQKQEEALASFEIIAKKTGDALSQNVLLDTEAFDRIVDIILYYLSDVSFHQQHVKQLNKIFTLISSHPQFTIFQINFYVKLLTKLLNGEAIEKIYDLTSFRDLTQTMKIKFCLNSKYKKEFNMACSNWSRTINDFFNKITKEAFANYINIIQSYYEFCVMTSSCLFEKCPYQSISSELLRIVRHHGFVDLSNSIYFNIPKEESHKTKIERLIKLYMDVLLDKICNTNFVNKVVQDFGEQIRILLMQKDEKHVGRMFNENYKFLCDTLFQIFLSTKSPKSIAVLSKFFYGANDFFLKSKNPPDLANFNKWLIEKLIKCTNHVTTEWNYLNKRSDDYLNLEHYFNFTYAFIEYISKEIKDKSCGQLCFRLIDSILKILGNKSERVSLVYKILDKYNFYVVKNYPQETEIVLIDLLSLISYYDEINACDLESTDEIKNHYGYVKSSLATFSEIMMPFKEMVKSIHPILYENLIFKPIEQDYQGNHTFKLINQLMNIVSFENFYDNDQINMKRLKLAFQKAASRDNIDLIQQFDSDYKTKEYSKYYKQFFEKISDSIKTRDDIFKGLNAEIYELVNVLMDKNEFANEFENDQLTVSYEITNKITQHCLELKSEAVSKELVDMSLRFWFNLYDKNRDQLFKFYFNQATLNACRMHKQIMIVNYIEKLWDFYFESNDVSILQSISEIFDLTTELFMNKISQRYANLIINENDKFPNGLMTGNYLILIKIAETAPIFFFKSLPDKDMNIFEMFELSKSNSNDMTCFVGLIYRMTSSLSEINILKEDLQNLFKNRRKLFRFLFVEGENKLPSMKSRSIFSIPHYNLQLIVKLVCDIYWFLYEKIFHNKKDVREIIGDLLEIIGEMNTKKEVALPIKSIEEIGKLNNKQNLDLVKEHYNLFLSMQKDKGILSVIEIQNSLNSLINFIENKNVEAITDQLNEHTSNIVKIEKNVSKQGNTIKNIQDDVIGVSKKLDHIEQTVDEHAQQIEVIDNKTLHNLPSWCKEIINLLEKIPDYDWILVAKRLNFSENDIKGWLNQHNPCMSMLQEWFVINKTSDAILGLFNVFKELNYMDCSKIIETNLKNIEENKSSALNDDKIDNSLASRPPQVFICFEWSSKTKAKLLKNHLDKSLKEQINIWFDDGSMGGGEARNKRIDIGLRSCNVLICLITKEISLNKTCLNQINLATQLNKAIIPLLLDNKMKWPPQGSLGPILSEYLFIRFFQRPPKELTNDDRYWPPDKFNELVMQLLQLVPTFTQVKLKSTADESPASSDNKIDIFISYQWDKQKDIICLYEKFKDMGLNVWLDIHQMGGGDSLYEKIDNGIRNASVVISCVTLKYSLSANCRKEVALADSISKPIIPILLEKDMKYPPAGPMAPTLAVLKYIDFTSNFNKENTTINWHGEPYNKLLDQIKEHLPQNVIEKVTSKACVIS